MHRISFPSLLVALLSLPTKERLISYISVLKHVDALNHCTYVKPIYLTQYTMG